jgi:hypothetical protein
MGADFDAALTSAQRWVGSMAGVVAVGEGRDERSERFIDVWVTAEAASSELPDEVGGVPVRVRDSGGEISAQ